MPRVWITDGSVPVFSDTRRLETSHRGLLGLPIRYEGFVDPDVPVGRATLLGDAEDVLCVEAEWCIRVPNGGQELGDETPLVVQGLLEGKWMNRLLGTRAWQPASLGNNLLAEGAGISTTLGALEQGAEGEVRLEYRGQAQDLRVHRSLLSDLRGENVPALVREVLAVCRDETLDWVDVGALGEEAAVVNERARLKASARPLPDPRNVLPHRAKERLVQGVLRDGVAVPPGEPVTLTTTDAAGAVVGRGTLVWERSQRLA